MDAPATFPSQDRKPGRPALLRRIARWFGIGVGTPRLSSRVPQLPPGERIYAIGDVHGQIPLLRELLVAIEADHDARAAARAQLILLGDFIDRGAGSAELLEKLSSEPPSSRTILLRGNHEAAMLDAVGGNPDAMQLWLAFGGAATLAGFGVAPEDIDAMDPSRMIRLARAAVPPSILAWMRRLPLYHRAGDYYFVHAGIRPGIALKHQRSDDQLWIREAFLRDPMHHDAMIVHGHTIHEGGPDMPGNRIGIDTGAYRTGRLTAIGLEGAEHWVIDVDRPDLITPGYRVELPGPD